MSATAGLNPAVADEDHLRAQMYRLLAHFLSQPPTADALAAGAALSGDSSEFGRAIEAFAAQCAMIDSETAADQYQDLFIGVGRGELVPFASYYLTGFLNEKPLAKLRQDMAMLGMERSTEGSEPEDHIASLLEMMAWLIDGTFSAPLSIEDQRAVYNTHIGSWAGHFFRDLESSKTSGFYNSLGAMGWIFLKIEEEAFAMM